MEDIVALCKRRGFVYPASEIYGGINGFWDYGPLGVQLKNNVRDSWWRAMVECPPIGPDGDPLQIVGLDSAIIQNPKAWVASGHVGGFNDPMVDCRESKKRYRADHLFAMLIVDGDNKFGVAALVGDEPQARVWADTIADPDRRREVRDTLSKAARKKAQRLGTADSFSYSLVRSDHLTEEQRAMTIGPDAAEPGTLTEPRLFNLMFETHVGATQSDDSKSYLRPETAQGIFLNYKNVVDTMRVRMPFGIAQVGKAFRNEVTPRNFVFRSREFEQMEMEWFCHPDEAEQWKEFWKDQRMNWYRSLGLSDENLTFRDHDQDELAHYATDGYGTVDVEYRWPFTSPGFGELEGIAHRTDFDLKQHADHAKAKLEYFDQQREERYYPHVIEPAAGLTRGTLAVICEGFTPTPERKGSKYILKFAPHLAPIKAGIFPLVNKEGMPDVARKLYQAMRTKHTCEYDAKQSIGKRYARMDEVGTPYCFTIDGQTLEDQTVTVRERDTASQDRIGIDKVAAFLDDKIR